GLDRLVVRARLLRGRALLDRLRLPGRCGDVRLADAVRGARPARLSRALYRDRLCAGASALDPRQRADPGARDRADGRRMAARPRPDRLSLEYVRLRAERAARARANRFADRPLGPDLPHRCDFRLTGRADRRHLARAQAMARAGRRPVAADRDVHLWPCAAVARTDAHGAQGPLANHA